MQYAAVATARMLRETVFFFDQRDRTIGITPFEFPRYANPDYSPTDN
jgi:hypothetical protein